MHHKHFISLLTIITLLTLGLVTFAVGPDGMPTAHADQALPPYAWYAVIWQQPADTLHWVGPLGEVASIQRPKLPNELAGSIVQLRISPDGRYMIVAASLTNQVEGIGIYDLQAGQFIQTHQAQPGETIHLGHQIFNHTMTRAAVGFKSGDYNTPAWRVIVFDLATGDASAVLDQTNPNLPPMQLSMPLVRYYGVDEGLGEEVIHFQMIPYGTGGAMQYPAYAWMPFPAPANQAIALGNSPYTHAESDVRFISGEEVFAYTDPNVPTLPAIGPGPTDNAIGRRIPVNGQDTTQALWVDGTAWHYRAQWAHGDDWVLYFSDNGQGMQNWNLILGDASPLQNQRKLLGPALSDVAGTPDGYLMIASETFVYYTNVFDDTAGTLIFQGMQGQDLDVVYVTPDGVQFTLPSLGDSGGIVVETPGDVVAPQACEGAPAPRLTVGQNARVTYTDGAALNVRNAPGGNNLAQLPEGTVVSVIGGPQCQDGYNWWQIQADNISGWSAEGDQQGYFLEPWNVAVTGPNDFAAVPTATATPQLQIAVVPSATPQLQIAAKPTVTPTVGIIITQNCASAPQQHVNVGMAVRAVNNGGTYAFFNNLTDEIPQNQIQAGSTGTIIEGPGCKNGFRFWKVQFSQGGQTLTGWISEGTTSQYFIEPL